jgi:hypothetical protein
MRSTKYLTVNVTKTLLIILGIVVAVLLTLNSSMMGDAASLTSGFDLTTADNTDLSHPDRLEQLQQIVTVSKDIYYRVSELLQNI